MDLNIVVFLSFFFLHLFVLAKVKPSSINLSKVDFFDVGQGSSVLISTKENCKILIDTGKKMEFLKAYSKTYPIALTGIDLLILTHSDYDHIGDFENVFNFFEPNFLMLNGSFKNSQKSRSLRLYTKKSSIFTIFAQKGEEFEICGLKGYVLSPDYRFNHYSNENEKSLTILFQLNNFTNLLITGDLERESKFLNLSDLKIRSQNKINLYLASHHGSNTSSDMQFLNAFNPTVSFIQAGINNPYSHPHAEIVNRICLISGSIFNTQVNGSIQVTLPSYIDEKIQRHPKLTIETQRGQPMVCE